VFAFHLVWDERIERQALAAGRTDEQLLHLTSQPRHDAEKVIVRTLAPSPGAPAQAGQVILSPFLSLSQFGKLAQPRQVEFPDRMPPMGVRPVRGPSGSDA